MRPSMSHQELSAKLSIPLLVIPFNKWMTLLFLFILPLLVATNVNAQSSLTVVRSVVSAAATSGVSNGSLMLFGTAGMPVIGLVEHSDIALYQGFWSPAYHTSTVPSNSVTGKPGILFNTPNPFVETTTINYSVSGQSYLRIGVYDLTGRLITLLVDDVAPKGDYHVRWNGQDNTGAKVATGYYIYTLEVHPLDPSQPTTNYRQSMILTR